MDEDTSVGEEMVRDLGIDPAAGVDSNQRAELLRRWHREDPADVAHDDDESEG